VPLANSVVVLPLRAAKIMLGNQMQVRQTHSAYCSPRSMLICNRSPILQDEVLAKEAAKIAYRRMQNEKRRVHIHDAKQRTIGLDIEALDAQVAKKRANASDDVDRMNIESKMSSPAESSPAESTPAESSKFASASGLSLEIAPALVAFSCLARQICCLLVASSLFLFSFFSTD
jgi:hypothetical protein